MYSVETTPGKGELAMRSQGRVLAVLVAAIVTVEVPKYVALLPAFRDWAYPCVLVFLGLQAGVPFLLARMAPRAAGFDRQWLPRARSQWAWFLGMVFLLFLCGVLTGWLASLVGFRFRWTDLPYRGAVTAAKVVLNGVIMVLLGPIAEELFWRGYALEQLRKLTRSGVALLIHSLVFAIVHLNAGFHVAISAFLYGTILGTWRIRLRSLVPLVLAHILLNGITSAQFLKDQYYAACVMSKPECRQIDLLRKEPIEKAVPSIIGYLADPDEDVRIYAESILIEQYRTDAEPYLKKALTSRDKNTLHGVLFVISMGRYSGLTQEVRELVRSSDDVVVQIDGLSTLCDLKDVEGLRSVAQTHPNETVRRAAERMLGYLGQ